MLLKMSLTSRIADFVSRLLIGPPKVILYSKKQREQYGDQTPDSPNFYLKEGDRFMPSAEEHTWKVKRWMIFEDQMRQQVARIVGYQMILLGAVGVMLLLFGMSPKTQWVMWTILALLTGAVVYAFAKGRMPYLSSFMPLEAMQEAAWAESNAVSRRGDVPHGKNTTTDLDDLEGRWDLTPEGYRVTGRVLMDDMLHGSYTPAAPLWIGLLPLLLAVGLLLGKVSVALGVVFALVCLVVTFSLIGFRFLLGMAVLAVVAKLAWGYVANTLTGFLLAGGTSMESGTGVTLLIAYAPWAALALSPVIFVWVKAYMRARHLNAQGTTANAASLGRLSKTHVTARAKQAAAAIKDKSDFIRLGKSIGVTTQKRDGYSPDAGKDFGLTINDAGVHIMIWGASGTGKSMSLLVRIARALLLSKTRIGALFLDNKGSLPYDMRGIRDDYKVLSPDDSDVGLLEGLNGEQRAAAFLAVVMEKASGDNAYWINNGATFVRNAFIFHEALAQWDRASYEEMIADMSQEEIDALPESERPAVTWLDNMKTVMDVTDMMPVAPDDGQALNYMGQLAEKMAESWPAAQETGLLKDAITYIARILPAMDDKLRNNIKSQVDSWFAPMKSSSKMYRWLGCETGEDISAVCKGAAYGLNTPFHKYKQAGLIAANMLKERVYSIVRNREDMRKWQPEDNWTPVALMIDECQETISKSEDTMFAVARSKGLIGIFAAQSLDAVVDKMGDKSALAFLGNIASMACFRATENTYKYMQSRLGMTENVIYTTPTLGIDYNFSSRLALTSPAYDPTHPNARMMRGMLRGGAGFFKNLFNNPGGSSVAPIERNAVVSKVERKIEPLLDLAEIDQYLQTPFCALIQVQRGGVRRRDIVQCALMDIQTGADIDPFAAEVPPPEAEVEAQ